MKLFVKLINQIIFHFRWKVTFYPLDCINSVCCFLLTHIYILNNFYRNQKKKTISTKSICREKAKIKKEKNIRPLFGKRNFQQNQMARSLAYLSVSSYCISTSLSLI